MQVFTTKGFARFARRERLQDQLLCEAVARAERGQIDADLGVGLVKQRIGRPGQGRSGGFRTIIFYRTATRAVFIDGFAKNSMANIDDDDLERFRKLAVEFLRYETDHVKKLVKTGAWIEVDCDDS